MAGYVHGSTKQHPVAVLNAIEARTKQAKAQLAHVQEEIREAKEAAERNRKLADQARLRHIAYVRDEATDPEDFKAECQEAYEAAMRAHPENLYEGPKRLRALNREVVFESRSRRQAHQEAA